MSRQAIDSAARILRAVPALIEKGDYSQALEEAEKALGIAEKTNLPHLIHWALMAKGEALDRACRFEEGVETYEKALDFSLNLFFEDTENTHGQEILYSTIGKLGETLEELGSVTKARQVCKKAEEHFENALEEYERLTANNPENSEYLSNYVKTMGNIWACYMVAEDLEKQVPLVPGIVQAYGKVIESDPEDPEDPENFLRLDNVVKKFGEACLEEGRFEEAKQVYEQAHTVYKNIYEKYPENLLALNFLLFSYNYFGKLYAEIGEMDKVEDYYSQALELAEERLRKDPEDLSILMNRGKIYQDLGRFYSEAEELEKANLYYEKAMVNFEGLIGKRPEDPEYQYHLSGILNTLAEDFRDISSVEKAKECYMHEIEIYESLTESEIDETDIELDIAATFNQIAHLYAEAEDTEKAKEYYEKEMEIYEKLFSKFPEETDYELYIAETLNQLGDLYFENEEIPAEKIPAEKIPAEKIPAEKIPAEKIPAEKIPAEKISARQYYERALAITEKAVEKAPEDLLSLSDHVQTLKNITELNKVRNDYEAAIPFQQRVLEVQLEIQKRFPDDWNHTRNLGNTFSELGLFFEKAGDMKQAEQFHSKAVETFSKILLNGKEPSIRRLLATEIQLRGYVYLRSKKYLSAKPYLELAHKYYESACTRDPNERHTLEGLFSVLYETGLLHYGMENFEKAIESYKAAFSVLDRLIEVAQERAEPQSKATRLYTGLGISYSALNEYEKSEEAFKKAFAINAELLEKEPENGFYLEDRAIASEEYANLLIKTGRSSEAETYKAESSEIYQKIEAKGLGLMRLQRNIYDV